MQVCRLNRQPGGKQERGKGGEGRFFLGHPQMTSFSGKKFNTLSILGRYLLSEAKTGK